VPRRRIVLLVEPDQRVRADFTGALEARGFEVWAAPDGPTGLALARTHFPGVIVGDFPLAQAAGAGFTTAVRTDERLHDAVIITVTDRHLTEKDSVAWLHSDRVLAKPIEPERLADEVAWAVDRSSPAGYWGVGA
jgi:two-component system KDP operon response regulator KdpE